MENFKTSIEMYAFTVKAAKIKYDFSFFFDIFKK